MQARGPVAVKWAADLPIAPGHLPGQDGDVDGRLDLAQRIPTRFDQRSLGRRGSRCRRGYLGQSGKQLVCLEALAGEPLEHHRNGRLVLEGHRPGWPQDPRRVGAGPVGAEREGNPTVCVLERRGLERRGERPVAVAVLGAPGYP